MDVIHVGPAILSAIAWGCSLNVIVGPAVAQKEGWPVPDVAYASQFRLAGKIGMFVSMVLAGFSAGLWGLLIAPAGGMLFGGISSAMFKEAMLALSIPIGLLTSIACGVWLFLVF